MIINVQDEITKALNKLVDKKIEKDDISLTYQEFFLFWVLRNNSSKKEIEINETIKLAKDDGWIDSIWLQTEASKHNDMSINVPWNKVFDWQN